MPNYVAYFDETGIDASSAIAAVTGFIASADTWRDLDKRWVEILNNVGVPYFHATECEAGDDVFSHLERPSREALFRGLANVITEQRLPVAVMSTCKQEVWKQARMEGIVGPRYEANYNVCFEECVRMVVQWATDTDSGPVDFVFARQQQFERKATEIFEHYRSVGWAQRFLGSLRFESAARHPALQAADLLAYELLKYYEEHSANPNAPLRPAMTVLARANLQTLGGEITAEYLDGLQKVRSVAAKAEVVARGPSAGALRLRRKIEEHLLACHLRPESRPSAGAAWFLSFPFPPTQDLTWASVCNLPWVPGAIEVTTRVMFNDPIPGAWEKLTVEQRGEFVQQFFRGGTGDGVLVYIAAQKPLVEACPNGLQVARILQGDITVDSLGRAVEAVHQATDEIVADIRQFFAARQGTFGLSFDTLRARLLEPPGIGRTVSDVYVLTP